MFVCVGKASGEVTIVATAEDGFFDFDEISVSESGTVIFTGQRFDGTDGVYLYQGGLTTFVDHSNGFDDLQRAGISSNGIVGFIHDDRVYFGNDPNDWFVSSPSGTLFVLNNDREGVEGSYTFFTDREGDPRVGVLNQGNHPQDVLLADINNQSTIAFWAYDPNSASHNLYSTVLNADGNEQSVYTLDNYTTVLPNASIESLALNDSDTLVYVNEESEQAGIWVTTEGGGPGARIQSPLFSHPSSVTINNAGQIGFKARYFGFADPDFNGDSAILRLAGDAVTQVLAPGDAIDDEFVFDGGSVATPNGITGDGRVLIQGTIQSRIDGRRIEALLLTAGGNAPPPPPSPNAFHWTNTDGGDFTTAGNWQENAVPQDGEDTAFFNLGGVPYTVHFTSNVHNGQAVVEAGDVTFGLGGQTYVLTGGVDSGLIVEQGKLTLQSGNVTASNLRARGGTLDVDNAHVTVENDARVGQPATSGSVTIKNGGSVIVAQDTRVELGVVTVTGQGSSWTSSLGDLHLTGGAFFDVLEGATATLDQIDAVGVLNVRGAASELTSIRDLTVRTPAGEPFSGALNVEDGGKVTTGGSASVSSGASITLPGGEPQELYGFLVSGAGSEWNLGTNRLTIGQEQRGSGLVTSGATVTAGELVLHDATLRITEQGTVDVGGGLMTANTGTTTAVVQLDNATLKTRGDSTIGQSGVAIVDVRGAIWDATGTTVDVYGQGLGGLDVRDVGGFEAQTLNMYGVLSKWELGIVLVGGAIQIAADPNDLQIGSSLLVEHSPVRSDSLTVSTQLANEDPTLARPGLDLLGSTTQFEVASNVLVDTGGWLRVRDEASLTVGGSLFVASGARVDGDGGTIRVDLPAVQQGGFLNQGLLAGGSSPGRLTIDGDYVQLPEGTLELEIGGTVPGVEMDQLTITGTAQIAGTVLFKFIDGFAPAAGQEFGELLHVGGTVDLSAASFLVEYLADGFEFDISPMDGGFLFTALTDGVFLAGIPGDYNNSGLVEQADLDLVLGNWGADAIVPPENWINDLPSGIIDQAELDRVLSNWGKSAALGSTAAVPEPATAALAVLGLATFLAIRRRPV